MRLTFRVFHIDDTVFGTDSDYLQGWVVVSV
jgi:hypothetical protein